jgi:hypothetical protein
MAISHGWKEMSCVAFIPFAVFPVLAEVLASELRQGAAGGEAVRGSKTRMERGQREGRE